MKFEIASWQGSIKKQYFCKNILVKQYVRVYHHSTSIQ